MLTAYTKGTEEKRSLLENTKRDEFLNILIERRIDALDKILQELVEKNNPTLQSIMKVEKLFKKHVEFASRSELLRELKGSMKPSVLNTIVVRLVSENKLIVNNDRSLTWIDTEGNEKLNKVFKKAVSL